MHTHHDPTPNQHGTPVPDVVVQTMKILQAKITPGFVAIEPGTFQMGTPPGEEGCAHDEVQHTVMLTQAFELKTTPVTEKEWRALMGNNPSHVFGNRPVDESSDDCPVQQVN